MREKIGKRVRSNHKKAEVKVKCAQIRSSLARHQFQSEKEGHKETKNGARHQFQSEEESHKETKNGEIRKDKEMKPKTLRGASVLCSCTVMDIITKSVALFIFIHKKIGLIYIAFLAYLLSTVPTKYTQLKFKLSTTYYFVIAIQVFDECPPPCFCSG